MDLRFVQNEYKYEIMRLFASKSRCRLVTAFFMLNVERF